MADLSVQRGAVTFLDVLGWKGIWEREKQAMDILHSLIDKISEHSIDVTNNVGSEEV